MHRSLLETLESFPPLRESIERLNELCEEDDVDILAFAQTIEADPMLYSDILRSVNAPFYGFSSEITSIRHALTLFGVSKVHGLALQSSLTQYADDDLCAYGISLQDWLNTMRQQQEFLFHLLKSDDDPVAFIKLSGVMFVLEMGKLAANYILKKTGQKHRFLKADPHALLDEERQVIGNTGDELAVLLFENWNFEPEFIELFRHSLHAEEANEHQKLAAMLQLTRTLITIYGLQPMQTAKPLIDTFGLNSDNVKAAYEHIKENFEHEALHMECKG
jgi:HD-like signal output (HDOD) protein